MSPSKRKHALLIAALAFCTGAAQASTITFEDIALPGRYIDFFAGDTPFRAAGYALTIGTGAASVIDAAHYVPALPAFDRYAGNGTDYLGLAPDASAILTSTAKRTFSVRSVDLANFYYDDPARAPEFTANVDLIGTRADGSQVRAGYSLYTDTHLADNDFMTASLQGFSDLTSFAVVALRPGSLAIDNIVIEAAAGDVPEPASLALLGLGLAAAGAARRRVMQD